MQKVTILVVDDEPNVCASLTQVLRAQDCRVLEATSPVAALAVMKSEKIDIVISDNLMPGMTGLEFLSLVRDRHPQAIRIMLTGHSDLKTALGAINDGELYRFLEKPCSPTELRVTVHLARERLELERENRHLLELVRSSPELMRRVEVEELTREARALFEAGLSPR
jgi:DNA-binding NtrC family response regulator